MSKFDSFNRDYNKCKNLESNIQDLLKEKESNSSNRIDVMLKSKMDTFKYEIDTLLRNASSAVENPFKYNITENEALKRREKVEALAEGIKFVESRLQIINGGKTTIQNINFSYENETTSNMVGDDGEYDNTRNKDNRQVLNVQKEMLKKQDEHYDELQGIAANMKENGRMIGQELDLQNDMMDNLNKDMDKTNIKMMRVDGKLKKLIAESNQ